MICDDLMISCSAMTRFMFNRVGVCFVAPADAAVLLPANLLGLYSCLDENNENIQHMSASECLVSVVGMVLVLA